MCKRIAVDCRYLGMSGLGRFLTGILENLNYEKNEFVLVGKKEKLDLLEYNFTPVYSEHSPFSAKGILNFPIKQVNACDVFFTPNFFVPFGISTQIFSVIHDVVFMDIKECNNGFLDRRIKKFFLKRAVAVSRKIFTVSEFSRKRIINYFPKACDKIVGAGNSVTKEFLDFDEPPAQKSGLIYVGNIKKHKGLHVLAEAFECLRAERPELTLTVVGNWQNFVTVDDQSFKVLKRAGAELIENPDGQTLLRRIAGAEFLIQPSFYEGFGLAPMEALILGTKPIISDIEVFREIYENFDVEFFETGNPLALVKAVQTCSPVVKTSKAEILAKHNYKDIADKVLRVLLD